MNTSIKVLLALACISPLSFSALSVAEEVQQFQNPEMVRVPGRNYEIGKYEVTQGLWRAVIGEHPNNKFSNCGDNCPVEQVSWRDAHNFIDKLNSMTGKQYRLPTGDEWEFACYGGKKTKYCGSNNVVAVAWESTDSGGHVHPVGQKKPNDYGLYDMSGNVDEWTEDCVEGDCALRILRGGAWDDEPQFIHATFLDKFISDGRDVGHGFRLVRTLP